MADSSQLPTISETSEAQLPSATSAEIEEENDAPASSSPLWNRDGWSLTWPIWHLLPIHEKKELAKQHGYKTIGEFEEYMSLHQAMDDSELPKAYPNEKIYGSVDGGNRVTRSKEDAKPTAIKTADEDSESDEESVVDEESAEAEEELSWEEMLQVGGKILMLHDEILHQVFAWLPVDTYATLSMVSPHWKHLTRTEAVYRRLCERLYLNQSKRRQLHVSRFGGSYRTMLEQRPRVRAAGGCYVMKYSQVKKIQRDMWTEVCSRSSFGSPISFGHVESRIDSFQPCHECSDNILCLAPSSGSGRSHFGKYLLSLPLLSRRWSCFICFDFYITP